MWIPLELIDVLTGKEEMDQLEAEDEPRVARNWAEKVWFWVA
jgi:amino acid transporter